MSPASIYLSCLIFSVPPGPDRDQDREEFFAEANCAGEPSLEFVSPTDGAMVESPITVEYIERDACNCDTGGCWDDPLDSVRLLANGEYHPASGGSVMISLPAGEHELTLTGEAAFHGESATITITVTGGDGGTGSGGGGESGGGNCSLSEPAAPVGVAVGLALLALVGLRGRN